MADDATNGKDGKFLSRWSRLKQEARAEEAVRAEAPATAPPQQVQKDPAEAADLPQLPPVDELTPESDFRGFLNPKVDEGVRRAALKKLFSDPHFNVMDGLDIYIDDYSKPDPLPSEMLAQMRSAQKIFKWARNELEEGESAPAATPLPAQVQAAQAAIATAAAEPPMQSLETVQPQQPQVTEGSMPTEELKSPQPQAIQPDPFAKPVDTGITKAHD